MKKLITFLLLVFQLNSFAQLNSQLDFETTALPTGWTQSKFYLTDPTDFPCQGQSIIANLYLEFLWIFWFGDTTASLTTNNAENIHGPIDIGFDFRVSDVDDDPLPLTNFDYGGVYIEYSLNNGALWTVHSTINSNNFTLNAAGCTRYTTTIPASSLVQGTNVKLRLRVQTPDNGPEAYDLYFYFDNLSIVQSPNHNCKNPVQVIADEITSTTALFTWQAPTSSEPITNYEYELRSSGAAGSGDTGLVASGTTTALSILIESLEPNKNYNFYIISTCGANRPFQWIASDVIRTPCANLPNVTAVDQTFCGPTTVADLAAEANDLAVVYWYNSPTGMVPLAPTDALTNGTYYASLHVNNCYSARRTAVVVTVHDKPSAPIIQSHSFCGTNTVADIRLTPITGMNLRWYDDNQIEINSQTALNAGTYYVSHYNANCESDLSPFEIIVRETPIALVIGDQYRCGRHEISSIDVATAPGNTVKWYESSDAITAISPTTVLRNTTYYASQTNGVCESERVAVSITVYDAVSVPLTTNQNFCTAMATVADLQITAMPGAIIYWYDTPTSTEPLSPNELLRTDNYYASQAWGECESLRVRITVYVSANIGALRITDQHFCESAQVGDLRVNISEGMQAKWYRDAEGGFPLSGDIPLENGIYYVAQGKNGCESARTAFSVIIEPKPASPRGEMTQTMVEGSRISDLLITANQPIWFGSLLDMKSDRNRLNPETGLLDQAVYYVVNQSSSGCFSDPLAIQVILTLGINEFDLKSFSYYPNPTTDWLTINYKETIKAYEIYDINGKKVGSYQHNAPVINVDLSSLASGIYVIQLHTADSSQSIKVIKK